MSENRVVFKSSDGRTTVSEDRVLIHRTATIGPLPEHGPWSRAETEGADLAVEYAAEDEVFAGGSRRLRGAVADPPYIGQSAKHYSDHPDYAGEVDHEALIEQLRTGYDCWALCLHTPSLGLILAMCKAQGLDLYAGDIRVMAWVKPFAAFKRNVRVAYTWEPVIVKAAERLEGAQPTRDYIAEPITMKRGLTGAKPEAVCHWLFAVMGLRRTDTLDDLFPGSGAVSRAWETWTSQLEMAA